ncbi:hypothetical protein RclHR1_02060003 [Rhizophagus clarus]|uniref:C2H2-type domain-containing protein n=1 Tax=Rhizophagus clarus TaxID=94130 RepID=A0A2Z6QRX4_9GLOM|nr:hypothetical protein RclHR1_02060003 [Rhizophagus clarus]
MSSNNISLKTQVAVAIIEFFCSTCQKQFKKQRGLIWHLAIVKKYNISYNNLDNLSELNNNKKFKNIFVYLIHRKLPNGFKREGHQLVSLAYTEHQFFDVFKGHIHYYNNRNGQKFYDEKQQTYVVLFNDLPQHLKNNPLAIATHHATESIITKRCKSKYNPGVVVIKWKIKVLPDEKHDRTFGIKCCQTKGTFGIKHDQTFGIKVREMLPDERHDQTFGIKYYQTKSIIRLLELSVAERKA